MCVSLLLLTCKFFRIDHVFSDSVRWEAADFGFAPASSWCPCQQHCCIRGDLGQIKIHLYMLYTRWVREGRQRCCAAQIVSFCTIPYPGSRRSKYPEPDFYRTRWNVECECQQCCFASTTAVVCLYGGSIIHHYHVIAKYMAERVAACCCLGTSLLHSRSSSNSIDLCTIHSCIYVYVYHEVCM